MSVREASLRRGPADVDMSCTDGGIWRRYLAVPARGAHGYDLSAAGFLPLFSLLSIGGVFKQIR